MKILRLPHCHSIVLSCFMTCFFLAIASGISLDVAATHSATTAGEIENRPAPVFRRVCLAGTNSGNYCKQNSECPGSSCATRNVFNITVAVAFDASTAQLSLIQTLITNMSGVLFDVTDGQAEIGTATIHNNAMSIAQADLVVLPSTNDTWWNANSGHYRTGGTMNVSMNYISNSTLDSIRLAHEFSHLVFDARDEYEDRLPNCGAVVSQCLGGVNAGVNCVNNAGCPGSSCSAQIGNCPDPASGVATGLMDGNGTELCWGQGDSTDLTDLINGNHDPANTTEQSSCRNNRSVWDQLVWAWPSTFLKPVGAPDPEANGAVVNPPNFIIADNNVRVVLVLDESGSMDNESPSRMQRLKVAAEDFITTAENGTEIGIVSYSNDAITSNGHAGLAIAALVNNRSNWNNAVTDLSSGGWTNIGDGLQKAKDMIVAAGGVTANTYIVLMTDGLNNRPSPQATADVDLQAKIDDLLLSGIPIYVTCTGGDLGLQSQCAEIATGTNGFNSDSADISKLPEKFVDFHEKITGHQGIDSIYGNFSKIEAYSPKTIFLDDGSQSISFSLLWEDAGDSASMSVIDPDGTVHQTRSIPQGLYTRIANPKAGEWQIRIDPGGNSSGNFVARAYTLNRVNSLKANLRNNSLKQNDEIYLYAIPQSFGGPITKEGEVIFAEVTLPNGSKATIELNDNGRDAAGHGDDLANDGIFTGVFADTSQKGAYGFQVKIDIEGWHSGEDGHTRDESSRSPRFVREVLVSGAVSDPSEVEKTFEDDQDTGTNGDVKDPKDDLNIKLLYVILVLLIIVLIVILRCCSKLKR